MNRQSGYLTVAETALILGLHPFTVYQHIWSGRISAEKRGRRVQIPMSSIAFEIERRKRKGGRLLAKNRSGKKGSASGADLWQQGKERR